MIVVASLPGSGTTSLTRWKEEEGFVATHEGVYGTRGPLAQPLTGQDYEVSGFAIPYRVDELLVRDPRPTIPNHLIRQRPTYQLFTDKHLGIQPHDIARAQMAWVRWFRWALEQEPSKIYRAEDIPLRANATGGPKRSPLHWNDLSSEVKELAEFFGYEIP